MAAAVVEISAQDDVDLSAFCRLCLQLPPESQVLDLNLIYDEEEQLTYNDCFTICTMIDLAADAGMPRNLCKSCGLELQVAYDFRKKVENSKRFLSQMKSTQIKAETEEEEKELEERVMLEQTGELSGGNSITSVEEVPVEQLESVEECEELEEHLEMDDYQTVEALEDDAQVECVFVEDPDSQPSIILSDINGSECLIESETDTSLPLTHLADSTASQTPVAVIPIRAIVPPALTPVVTLTTVSNKSPSAATIAARKLPTRIPRSNAKVRCDFCPKLFVNRSKMLNHRHMHEVNRRHYACPQLDCDRIYLSKQSCDLHYKQTHCKPEQFGALQCTVCHKHFAIAQTLEVHMRYHTRDFPFECELCGKKFAQKGHMTTHLQVRHNNLRYACTEPGCAKVFKNSISLRNHCFVHTGMPFRCAYCDKGYPQKSKLKVHISSKHNVEMSIDELEAMRKLKSLRTRHSFVRLEEETLEEVGQYECGGEDVEEDNLQIIEPKQQYEDFVEEIEVTL